MLRRPYHPPLPSPYLQLESDTPGYILGEHGGVVGFGKRGFYVAAIPAQKARETILRHHYSQSIVNNAYIHLGVYYKDNYAGVLQLGYALNPASAGKIVEGTVQGEYLELNRMWLADVCPRNSESMAISYAVKYTRRASPNVAWIQSFADERCGRLGGVMSRRMFWRACRRKPSSPRSCGAPRNVAHCRCLLRLWKSMGSYSMPLLIPSTA